MPAASTRALVDMRLWNRFLQGRFSSEEIAAHPTLRRWERCAQLGARPEGPSEPVLAPLEPFHDPLHPLAALLEVDAPFEAFADSMAEAGFCGVLADDTGVVVSRRASSRFEGTLLPRRLVEGAVWSESARGTNAIGTVLAERAPVSIVGAEHFEQGNHVFACYAAPVYDARRRLVAVLDATGPARESGAFAQASVTAAAAAMEALLLSRAYHEAVPGGMRTLERLLASLPHAAMLVEIDGRPRRANDRFRALVPRWRERPLADAVRFERTSERAGNWLTPSPGGTPPVLRGFRLEVEPVGPTGDPFAAIVHLLPRRRLRPVAAPPVRQTAFAEIAGSDPAIVTARERAARFARTRLPVLLLAETGTGKELFARATHRASDRADGPFVAVNCAALTGSLLESELFGYGPGAFTGARPEGQTGKLAASDGGTLFLDEVAEMAPAAQAALLRFLEDGTFYRVGEHIERRADVRLVAATSCDMPGRVSEGRFRADLFYRLRGVTIRLPALRERSDRAELVAALLARLAARQGRTVPLGVSAEALRWIQDHDWPGNVRELRTALEYALVLAEDSPRIELWHLPAEETNARPAAGDLRALEHAAVLSALEAAGGNMSQAARRLGVARSTLYRMLARQGREGSSTA